VLDSTKDIITKLHYSIKNKFLKSIAIGSFILSIFAGNIYASSGRTLQQSRKTQIRLDRDLFLAAQQNNMPEAQRLLKLGANSNVSMNQAGETAMHAAYTLKMITRLLANKGNIHVALYNAVLRNDVQEARRLLELGADPNAQVGLFNRTPMHEANTQAMVDLLRAHGGNIDVLLYQAAAQNDLPEAQRLLELGADPNAPAGLFHRMPMQVAYTQEMADLFFAHGGNVDVAVCAASKRQAVKWRHASRVWRLLKAHADFNDLMSQDQTPMYEAEAYTPEIADLLRLHGGDDTQEMADILFLNGDEANVALYEAVEQNDTRRAQQLLERGADPNAQVGPYRQTAMHVANDPVIIELLLAYGGNPNMVLYLAVAQDRVQRAERLLNLGADPNASAGPLDEIVMHAVCTQEMTDLLSKYGGNIHLALFLATLNYNGYNKGKIEQLLALGANPNARVGPNGETAMHVADPEIIDLLRSYGGTIDINLELHRAVWLQDVQKVQRFLRLEADPNAIVDPILLSAMHIMHTPEILDALLEYGGNADVALYQAVLRTDIQAVRRLLELGADPNAPVGPEGRTAIDLAYFARTTDPLVTRDSIHILALLTNRR
jgi:ankyrin repeat protein